MEKPLLTALILIVNLTLSFGQQPCDIINHYEDFITAQRLTFDEKDYLVKRVVETDTKSCFSELVNNNTMFVDYLLTNFSSNSDYDSLMQLTDSVSLRKAFYANLKKDSLFNSIMNEWVSKTIDNKGSKDTLSMDKLLNMAVKYFSIIRLSDEGHYVGKVCVGLNDIKKTEPERKPFVEAFCFASIVKHYDSEEFHLYDEFVKAIKELYKVNLGIDKGERLLRAQGAMFLLMRNNESLKKMLKTEYERRKNYLPFILTDK